MKSVKEMLKDTDFSEHKVSLANKSCDFTLYHNQADSAKRNSAKLVFARKYTDLKEAILAANLIDIAIVATEKGTGKYQNQDELLRAAKMQRMNLPRIYQTTARDRLFLEVELNTSSSLDNSLKKGLILVEDMFFDPLFLKQDKLYKEAVSNMVQYRQNLKNEHDFMANHLFNRTFLDYENTPTLDERIELSKNATLNECVKAFSEHLINSCPVLIYSGNQSPSEIIEQTERFLNKTGCKGDKKQLIRTKPEKMKKYEKPVHMIGPSDQMYLKIIYYTEDQKYSKKEKAAIRLLNNMLGGDWTTPLMNILREKHHLVYGIYSYYFKNYNNIIVETNHSPENYHRILNLVEEIVADFTPGNLDEDMFNQIKDTALEKFLIRYSESILTADQPEYRIADAYSRFVSRTEKDDLLERYKIIESVSFDDVNKIVDKLFTKKQVFTYCKVKP